MPSRESGRIMTTGMHHLSGRSSCISAMITHDTTCRSGCFTIMRISVMAQPSASTTWSRGRCLSKTGSAQSITM